MPQTSKHLPALLPTGHPSPPLRTPASHGHRRRSSGAHPHPRAAPGVTPQDRLETCKGPSWLNFIPSGPACNQRRHRRTGNCIPQTQPIPALVVLWCAHVRMLPRMGHPGLGYSAVGGITFAAFPSPAQAPAQEHLNRCLWTWSRLSRQQQWKTCWSVCPAFGRTVASSRAVSFICSTQGNPAERARPLLSV